LNDKERMASALEKDWGTIPEIMEKFTEKMGE